MAYYLKYRPQTLSELVGQDHIKENLQKAFQNQTLSHAYLFCGTRGTGKTSTARILAKMVNCEVVSSSEFGVRGQDKKESTNTEQPAKRTMNIPCNTCASCISITDGSSLDLIEIDAASNRGIDDIRELRENVKLAPISSQKKVYIIDEVHMLTTEAFNALLKTLEEPPKHVLFILATTELHKVPQTILSRVQRFDFKTASQKELLESLEKVVKEEKIEIDQKALEIIAKKGEGSFRDSLKILDQIASTGEKITLKLVEDSFKAGGFDEIIRLLETIAHKDSTNALNLLTKEVEAGVNVKEYLYSLLSILRAVLFIKNQVLESVKEEYGSEDFPKISDLAAKFSMEHLVKVLELLQKAGERMKFASIQSLPLEIAVVEASISVASVISVESVEQEVVILEGAKRPMSKAPASAVESLSLSRDSITTSSTSFQNDKAVGSSKSYDLTDDQVPAGLSDLPALLDKWTYILETVKPYNYSLEALLKQVKILSCDGGVVLFEVPYSFHQRILEAPKSRNLLESVLTDVLGKPMKVSTKLGVRPVRIEELANVELAQDDEVIKIAAEIFNSDGAS